MLKRVAAAIFILLGVVSFCGGVDTSASKTAAQYFERARQEADLHQDGAAPFRLKANFTVTDEKGRARTGDYSEVWMAKDRWRREITIGPYHEATSCVAGDSYRLASNDRGDAGAMEILNNLAPDIPYSGQEPGWTTGTAKISGAEFARASHTMHFNDNGDVADATYFFSPQSGALRLSATIMEQSSYNDMHEALGRLVPYSTSIKFAGGKRSVAIHIASFEPAGTVSDDSLVIAGAAKSKCDEGSGFLGSDATSPVAAKPVSIATIVEPSGDPIYPLSARNAQAEGSVVVGLAMDRFGRMRNMRIISSPREDLARAALVAVRENHYKPYTVNGVPTDVDGFITVKFLYSTTCTGNRC